MFIWKALYKSNLLFYVNWQSQIDDNWRFPRLSYSGENKGVKKNFPFVAKLKIILALRSNVALGKASSRSAL